MKTSVGSSDFPPVTCTKWIRSAIFSACKHAAPSHPNQARDTVLAHNWWASKVGTVLVPPA
jgi:hypothetical protein